MANWKIKRIEVENFKFFKSRFQLDIDCKNLLLYGENGAGKSSLYWSFFTHFQASTKTEDQAKKYFQHGHNENLRNRYASAEDNSEVSITFENESGSYLVVNDSLHHYYCNDTLMKDFMRLTMMSSDFMNYKFLSSLFDFCNSEDNEVFSLFEKEVLPFIDLDDAFTPIFEDATIPSLNSSVWWKYLNETYIKLPRNKKNHNFNQQTNEYKSFIKLIGKFNDLMKDALAFIEGVANSILENDFKIDARIKLEYRNATFNNPKSKRSRDGQLHPPRILIHAKMDDNNIQDTSIITHPKSFFNEAKITCMALALRLSILERRPGTSQAAAVLFIDDLLISLDMSFRKHVIRILFNNYVNRYQIILLTHDRAFFHLVWAEIENRRLTKGWKKCELYSTRNDIYPASHLVESPTYLEQAKRYLKIFHLPACANTLRRLCEQQMRRILPISLQFQINERDPEKVSVDLNGLITNYKRFIAECQMVDVAPSLQNDRRLILNPFSHDDIESPFYRQELDNLISELEKLVSMEKRLIVDNQQIRKLQFKMEVNNGEHTHYAIFEFLESFIELKYYEATFLSNPKVRVKSSSDERRIPLKDVGLRNLFSWVYNAVSLRKDTAPKIEDCLFNDNGGLLIQH